MAVSKAKPKTKHAPSKPAIKPSAKSKPIAKPKTAAKAAKPKSSASAQRAIGKSASRLIDERIRSLGDWRGNMLARMRKLILEADSEMIASDLVVEVVNEMKNWFSNHIRTLDKQIGDFLAARR